MSGGSYDYSYHRVSDMADAIEARLDGKGKYSQDGDEWSYRTSEDIEADKVSEPFRRWFATHLRLVAEAMHDIEWVDSGDYGPGDEIKAIEAVKKHVYG